MDDKEEPILDAKSYAAGDDLRYGRAIPYPCTAVATAGPTAAHVSTSVPVSPVRVAPLLGIARLPLDALAHVFTHLTLTDIQSCMLVCRTWSMRHAATSAGAAAAVQPNHRFDSVWNQFITRREWIYLSPDYIQSHARLFSSKKHFVEHLIGMEKRLFHSGAADRHAARVAQWRARNPTQRLPPPAANRNGLTPLISYDQRQILADVQFITRRHTYGFAAYFFAVFGAMKSTRAGFIAAAIGAVARYVSYDAYLDEEKREPKRERLSAAIRCLCWGVAVATTVWSFRVWWRHQFGTDDDVPSPLSLYWNRRRRPPPPVRDDAGWFETITHRIANAATDDDDDDRDYFNPVIKFLWEQLMALPWHTVAGTQFALPPFWR